MDLNDVSLVIIGYDPYKDVWDHYFDLLNKYWKDRPATYLVGNTIQPIYAGVTVLSAGADAEWSKKVQVALDAVKTKYIVLLLEDFFTTFPVSNKTLQHLVQIMDKGNAVYCKLQNQSRIKGEQYKNYSYLHVLDKKSEYGVSLQPAIWNREFLKKLVGTENYNAWIFEINQVKSRVHCDPNYLCLGDRRNILKITHAVVQSEYLPAAIRIFKKQNYRIDTSKRPVMPFKEYAKYKLKRDVSEITPEFLKPMMKRIGRTFKVDFVSDRMKGM